MILQKMERHRRVDTTLFPNFSYFPLRGVKAFILRTLYLTEKKLIVSGNEGAGGELDLSWRQGR